MAAFGNALAQHMADKLNVDIDDVIGAFDSFVSGDAPKAKVAPAKSKAAPKAKTSAATSGSTCERYKRGQTDPCGKAAKRTVADAEGVDHWYCGSDKSGCFSIMLKASSEKALSDSGTKKTTGATSKKKAMTNESRKEIANTKSESLLRKVTQTKKLSTMSIVTSSFGKIWYDKNTRVLFDKVTHEAYGILDESNEKILPLDDENIRWLEASNYTIRAAADDDAEESDGELDIGDSDAELDIGDESDEE